MWRGVAYAPLVASTSIPTNRVARLADACEAAIERVAAKTAARLDVFAELGEALFWLTALTEENGRSGVPLLSGLKWARNRVAHGVIVAAPVRRAGLLVGPGGDHVGPGGGTVGPSGHLWLKARDVPLGPKEGLAGNQRSNYEAHVAGQPLVPILRDGLALAR